MTEDWSQRERELPVVPAGHPLARTVAVILFVTLALGLVVPNMVGAGYILLGLLGAYWLTREGGWRGSGLSTHERLLLFAVVLFIVVWFAAWLVHGLDPVGGSGASRIVRLVLIIPVYLFVRQIDGLEQAWWRGLVTGSIIAGIYAIWFVLSGQEGQFEFRVEGTTNPIYFGGIVLIMGVMLLPRISDDTLPRTVRLLAAFGVFMALTASALSGSRGVWLAVPIVLLIYLWTVGKRQPPRWRFGVPAILLSITLAVMLLPESPLVERTIIGFFEIIAMVEGRVPDDTVGIRMQLWQLGWALGTDNLLFGAGPNAFREALEAAVADGRLSEAYLEYRHEHNQFLTALTIAGLPGLLSMVLLFALPLLRFVRLWQTGLHRTRFLGWCGLVAILMLAVMSLSESIFERNNGIVWYGLLTALSAGLVQSRRRAELHEVPSRKHTISVIVICKNEADRIERCLQSVAGWADEIIVLDSGSTDDTVELCRRYTDRVEVTDWPGFGPQKQRALDRAGSEWVLSLDADEALSSELRREIDLVLAENEPWHDGYQLPWLTRVMGRELHHGRWTRSPLRLFKRRYGRFTPALVHEKVVLDRHCRIGHLEASLYHYAFRDLEHFRVKLSGYARLQAQQNLQAGKRIRLTISPYFRAFLRLFDNIFLRGGFLDGRIGLALSWLETRYVYEKHERLRQLSAKDTGRHHHKPDSSR